MEKRVKVSIAFTVETYTLPYNLFNYNLLTHLVLFLLGSDDVVFELERRERREFRKRV